MENQDSPASFRKRDRDGDEREPALDITSTAAMAFDHESDRKKVFKVVEAFDTTFGKSRHKIAGRTTEWPKRATLRFDLADENIILSQLENVIRESAGYVLDLIVRWKPSLVVDAIVPIPGDDKRDSMFPIHSQQFYRSTEFKKLAHNLLSSATKAIPSQWKRDIESLDGVVTTVYNLEKDLDFVTCDLDVLPNERRYCLHFQSLNSVSYSFLEYLTREPRNRIHEVTANAEGLFVYVRSNEDQRPMRRIALRQEVYDYEKDDVSFRSVKTVSREQRLLSQDK